MVINVVSSICPPFPSWVSYISAVLNTRCSTPPCMTGGQRSVLQCTSSFVKCFLVYSSYINIMQFWKVNLIYEEMLTFSSFFNEIGQIKKPSIHHGRAAFWKLGMTPSFWKMLYIFTITLIYAERFALIVLYYFILNYPNRFINLFNIFEKDSKYHYTYT